MLPMKTTHSKPLLWILALCPLIAAPVVFSGNDNKVTICHKGRNTITVAEPALRAHLAHGDTMGPCEVSPSLAP